MSEIKDRIKERRLALGLTMLDVAKKLGVQETTVQRYESGAIKNIKHETIVKLAKILNCTPAYLMGWEETESTPASDLLNAGIKNVYPVGKQRLPMLGSIACGDPIYMTEEHEFYISAGKNLHADFCLKATGDSMIGARIHDGDIVFIRLQQDVDNGTIAAVSIDDEATLKRVYKHPNYIVLAAENPAYEPIIINGKDAKNIHIIGKAVAFMSAVK